jgi:SAM-dependent methyltransferase
VLAASRRRILESLPDRALVLDVGGWAVPFPRADWVIDLEAYETRGAFGYDGDPAEERFSAETWVQRDICDREPWPFEDGQFDFVVCSHTLEDVRDPIFCCSELVRVAKAGYVEVPSRLAEQSWGAQGDWVGWGHHHWLIDVDPARAHIDFVFKPHILSRAGGEAFPPGFYEALTEEERVSSLWWEGSFTFAERAIYDPAEHHAYLRSVIESRPVEQQRGTGRVAAAARQLAARARR